MESHPASPNPLMVLPFAILLGAIALAPLLCPAWWHRHYPKVAFGLAAVTLGYYLVGLRNHERVLETAKDYLGFIALIGSLYVVSGGIHMNIKGEATPLENVVFLVFGALTANLLGTTGASMLLIRPWIRMNRYRITAYHIVFFIFIVSNVGGCLTPIGDPPLFLGYLKGIPFWWVAEHCWPMWALGLGILLFMFWVVDLKNYLRAPKKVRADLAEPRDQWRFEGLGNLFFLGVILAAVFFEQPALAREGLMLAAAIGSYFTTRKSVHQSNGFNFHPVREVAILFAGIFLTMMPALDWLQASAGRITAPGPGFFYWSSGMVSSVLDNAPTYLSFLSATLGSAADADTVKQVLHLVQTGGSDLAAVTGSHAEQVRQTFMVLQKNHGAQLAAKTVTVDEVKIAFLISNTAFSQYILAISIGSVFFGACTYIGNGPNFMVKSIADQQKIRMPGFIGYLVQYALPFMLPMLLAIWLVFFRH